MVETAPQGPGPMPVQMAQDTRVLAILVYVLYLIGWPVMHLTTIGGLIVAYIKRDESYGTIWQSHFSNQIEIFWISLIVAIVAIPLCFVLIGIPIMAGLVLWFLYRTIKGLIRAIENKPYY